jgi:hypothetical protein
MESVLASVIPEECTGVRDATDIQLHYWRLDDCSGHCFWWLWYAEASSSSKSICPRVISYLVLNGRHLAKVVQQDSDPAEVYFCHTDMLGSIRAITDSSGEVAARFEYEPFGLVATSTGPLASGAHRFTGKPEDGAV